MFYVIAFGMSMFLIVGMTFFQYIHSEDAVDFAYVCGLTAAYAASSMIPSNGVLRMVDERTTDTVLPTLMILHCFGLLSVASTQLSAVGRTAFNRCTTQ